MRKSSFHFSAARSLPEQKIRCMTVRNMARSTENVKRESASIFSMTEGMPRSFQIRSNTRAGPSDRVRWAWSDPARQASKARIAVVCFRMELARASSFPEAMKSSVWPRVATTRCLTAFPSRVFWTICRYDWFPTFLTRRNMAHLHAPLCYHAYYYIAKILQSFITYYWHHRNILRKHDVYIIQ